MADASSDLVWCLSNLKLGSSGKDTETSESFWNASTVELKFGVEHLWLDDVWKCEREPNIGLHNLNGNFKRVHLI